MNSEQITKITPKSFGKTAAGEEVKYFELKNKHGMVAEVANYGATLLRLLVPDDAGSTTNIVLGFDNMAQYQKESPYFGSTVGRVANRIAKGEFELDSKRYKLAVNNGPNTLHGGIKGFDKQIWEAKPFDRGLESGLDRGLERGVVFNYISDDMEEGFPGKMSVTVTYTLTDDDELRIDYEAMTDKPTPINLTNHSYFNLAGAGSSDILSHELTIYADKYTPVDDTLIPVGTLEAVSNTSMDFKTATAIGARIDQGKGGYDHNYAINQNVSAAPKQVSNTRVGLAAEVKEPKSGRRLMMYTTEPGVQFYSGNFLDGSAVGNGGAYKKHYGFCLEAQHFPDSVHQPAFPNSILRPGDTYRQTTIYQILQK